MSRERLYSQAGECDKDQGNKHLSFSFRAVMGLHCCEWASSACGERGLLFAAEHRFYRMGFSHCGARA